MLGIEVMLPGNCSTIKLSSETLIEYTFNMCKALQKKELEILDFGILTYI